MDGKELAHRFAYHPPTTPKKVGDHQGVRVACSELAARLDELLPDGREKALAMTQIEQAMFWANAAIARNP
ncbi:Acb2/Tad1 domain-containing protein [Actinomadura harenae]|uniref:Acb2/Tad1 hairpin domain-containing protein n=1 Tax=Actinomadura harenae TaxID=2483351 RepID=A0A3M2MDK5_9ACTN|nr:hypothetical protein [Actinomadura harenae]RMI47601.1 hypothetical protein EBO15_01485 [Actinomadura harenae]